MLIVWLPPLVQAVRRATEAADLISEALRCAIPSDRTAAFFAKQIEGVTQLASDTITDALNMLGCEGPRAPPLAVLRGLRQDSVALKARLRRA